MTVYTVMGEDQMCRKPQENFGEKKQNEWLLQTSEKRVKLDLLEGKAFWLLKLEAWEERKLVSGYR